MPNSDAFSIAPLNQNRVICVLGMHRSGTSCLAGTLEQAGVFLGEVATHNKFNVKGNRENPAIRAINGQVLHDNGGDWNRPPARPVVWQTTHREARDAIIRSYGGQPVWGFKDPRALLTLEGWLEALPHLEFVGVVRHPLSVARSLRDRPNGPALADGIRLWTIYNARLLEFRQRFGFPVVSFDAATDQLQANLIRVVANLKLPPLPSSVATPFFDPELKHQAPPDASDPDLGLCNDETLSIYERLNIFSTQVLGLRE